MSTAPPVLVYRDDLAFRNYLCDVLEERRAAAADPTLEAVDIVEPEQINELVIRTGVVLSDGSKILVDLDLRHLFALAAAPCGTAH